MVSVANDLRPSNLDGHNRIQTHDLKSLFLSKVKEEGAKKKKHLNLKKNEALKEAEVTLTCYSALHW